MCGIFGVLHPRRDLDRELSQMRELLAHRGPDGEGIEKVEQGILGHRRLSIIDLSAAGAQPMWDVQRRACVTYNGEIYNFRELRGECLHAGLAFKSSSDTEVIVNQYLLHGAAAFERLNGIFAFCLHDRRSGEFFLVRDAMGVKPLYYSMAAPGLLFASELKALTQSGCVAPEIDQAALQAYLQLDFVPAPLSMIRGVRKLPGGHCLRIDRSGAVELRRFAAVDASRPAHETIAGDVAEFDRLMHSVVARQMVADVPVGVFLSGGIDSSIVAQIAAEVAPSGISTFSVGFEDPSFDESQYFSAVSRAIGSDHHCEILTPTALLDILPTLPTLACEPLADGSILPTYLLSRFTRRRVKVALSGDGADELFGGYPTYQAARWAAPFAYLPDAVPRALLRLAHATLPVNYDNFSLDYKVKKFLAGLHPDPIARNERWLGSFLPEELPALLSGYDPSLQSSLAALLCEPAAAAGNLSWLEKLLRTDERFYLQDGTLVKIDRASMAASLEVRVPFLDLEVVRFARGLPSDRKLHGRHFKHLLKCYARGRLPEVVLQRAKKGFGAPLGKWFRAELKELLQETLSPRRIAAQGIFRPEFVSRLCEEHWRGYRDHRKQLFNLLTFALWHEHLQAAQPRANHSTSIPRGQWSGHA